MGKTKSARATKRKREKGREEGENSQTPVLSQRLERKAEEAAALESPVSVCFPRLGSPAPRCFDRLLLPLLCLKLKKEHESELVSL